MVIEEDDASAAAKEENLTIGTQNAHAAKNKKREIKASGKKMIY